MSAAPAVRLYRKHFCKCQPAVVCLWCILPSLYMQMDIIKQHLGITQDGSTPAKLRLVNFLLLSLTANSEWTNLVLIRSNTSPGSKWRETPPACLLWGSDNLTWRVARAELKAEWFLDSSSSTSSLIECYGWMCKVFPPTLYPYNKVIISHHQKKLVTQLLLLLKWAFISPHKWHMEVVLFSSFVPSAFVLWKPFPRHSLPAPLALISVNNVFCYVAATLCFLMKLNEEAFSRTG